MASPDLPVRTLMRSSLARSFALALVSSKTRRGKKEGERRRGRRSQQRNAAEERKEYAGEAHRSSPSHG